MSIIVFGSINMDLATKVSRLPVPGETLRGRNFTTTPGGKGGNQAMAIARLGGEVYLVGRVGGDRFGEELRENLQTSGVNTDGVWTDAEARSGVAFIAVGEDGENQIIVAPGANDRVGSADLERLQPLLPDATALLLQLEIPLPAVQAAATAARQKGVKVILDPAPIPANCPETLYSLVDILTPNAIEASQLVGFAVEDRDSATQAAKELCRRGVGCAIVTLGGRGLVAATATESWFTPADAVATIDTVAAGDAFNGSLAVALAEGLSFSQALSWGAAAGALATTKVGAQSALPNREALQQFLGDRAVSHPQ